MRVNRKQNIKLAVLVLILLLGIGFAALAANLKIDGTVNVSKTSWDVHFENVAIIEGSVTANPAPTSNNTDTTEMTYKINFTKPGDYFEFTTDIVNDGTIDAMVDVVSNNAYANASSTTPITLPTYLTSTVTYSDGVPIAQNQELLHNTSEKIKVRVEFKKDINVSDLPSSGDTSIVFKFIGDYKQADDNAININNWMLPTGKTKDNLEVGDEICIRNQCFNFIRYDNDDIVMLSKYNLKVGNIYEHRCEEYPRYYKIGEYTSSDSGYGLQSSEVLGQTCSNPLQTCSHVEDCDGIKTYGTVAFSATNYWYDGSSLKPEYGTSYPADVYDGQYKGAPDETNYSVAYYVDGYKTKLTEYGVTIKDARLLTYAEVTDSSIGCSESSGCPTTGFIRNTSFWLGSADSYGSVWSVISDNSVFSFGRNYFSSGSFLGVRPVVVIEKANF